MTALLFLFLAFLTGWLAWRRLAGDPAELTGALGLPAPAAALLAPWLSIAASFTLGLLILTSSVFALASLASAVLPEFVYPLLPANLAVFLAVPILAILDWRTRQTTAAFSERTGCGRLALPTVRQQPSWASHRLFLLSLLAFTAFAAWLAYYSFHRDGASVSAGASVFSDFSTHTALVSSFAKGRNIPVGYPHFANDGIAYHFLFFFLCGNLNYLGLPIDLAINLPSILTFVAFCVLLGTLAVCITRFRPAFFLAPYLMVFRSSFAFLTHLRELARMPGATAASVLRAVLATRTFIGGTPRDDWGLWGLNVYANQRHLLLGFSALLVVVFLFLPLLLPAGVRRSAKDPRHRTDRPQPQPEPGAERWQVPPGRERRRVAAALVIALLLPYFHGSALIAVLLILAGLMPFSRARNAHVIFAITAVVSAIVQGRLFRSSGLPLAPQAYFGFIAEERTLSGVIAYLGEMSGLLLPLALLAAFLFPQAHRLLLAFSLPLLFGFTFSLTPDVTVNHKYLMFTFGLLGCLVAGLIGALWRRRGRLRTARRILAAVLLLFLSLTGWMELIVFRNINQVTVSAALNAPLATFVETRTPPRSVFVTAPLSYHTLFFTGRQVYFGHAYYAWSAGHDTFGRGDRIQDFLAAPENDLEAAQRFIAEERVDYLMIDDELRQHPEFDVNEDFFRQHFQQVAFFPGMGSLRILDLHQPLNAAG